MVDIKRWGMRVGAFLTGMSLAYGISWAITQPQVEEERKARVVREAKNFEEKINYFLNHEIPRKTEEITQQMGYLSDEIKKEVSSIEATTKNIFLEMIRPKPFTEKSPRLNLRSAKIYQQLNSKKSKEYLEDKIARTSEFIDFIKEFSAKYGIPYDIFMSIIVVESGGNNYAISKTGATGLVQMTETTAGDMNNRRNKYNISPELDCLKENVTGQVIDARYVPEISLECGAAYLSRVISRANKEFPKLNKDQRIDLAIAAYNGGFGGISRALKESKAKNFWQIPAKNAPSQSFSYVPKVRAVQKFLHLEGVISK